MDIKKEAQAGNLSEETEVCVTGTKDSKNINVNGREFVDITPANGINTPHTNLLQLLLNQVEKVNFKLLIYPQLKEIQPEIARLESKLKDKNGVWHPDKADSPEWDKLQSLVKQAEKMKVSDRQYIILSIEHIIHTAERNKWGLCKNLSFIYLYNGTYWNEIDKELFQKFLGEAAEKMGVQKFNARYFQFRESLFKQFVATAYLPAPEIRNDKVLINLLNGTFEVSNKGTKLRQFEPRDFLTYQLPFEYNPQAKAPLFESYLNKVLPDIQSQYVLAEYLGYVFIKHGSRVLKEEKALILYGTGANGKSVFFEIVTAIFGRQNVSNYSLQNLTEEKGFYRSKISNTLVNYASEINGKLETSLFKAMVSGEPVEACLKYGQPFTMTDYAKFIFNCNELPKDVEHTNAYFRRFLIIPFEVTIPEHEQDKNLHSKIIENELSGVFNWILEGLNRLIEQKRFSRCEAAERAISQYKTESNSAQMFINEFGYTTSSTKYELIKNIYPDYRSFCSEDGITPFKKSNFVKQLKSMGFIVDRVSQNQLAVYIENDYDF